ncbi:hypothetical protein OB985_04265 [Bacillus cereus]|nr:hypothetical protein [Bacillus cereus]
MSLKAVSSVLKSVGSRGGKKLATAGGLAFGADTAMNLYGGDDLGTSVLKAGVTGALAASNPLLFGGITVASMAQEGYWGLQQFNHQKKQWWNAQYATNNRVGGNYVDTQRAQTMRQAAVQAIQGSKMNARSALGGEAKILNPYASRRY